MTVMGSDARAMLSQAERIVIGAGAGLSASGGLAYDSPEFFQKHYPDFARRGHQTIFEMMNTFWDVNDANETKYWAFVSQHLLANAQIPAVQPYLDLLQYLQSKDYFVVTTNVDQQFQKARFPPDRVWAMQGDYAFFQCEKPCRREIYFNEQMVHQMNATFNTETLEIDRDTVPRCPHCRRHLVPNLRKDAAFVEEPHYVNQPLYNRFLSESRGKRVVFLELGVGVNSPGAIKYPFEQAVAANPTFRLVRVNLTELPLMLPIEEKSVTVQGDIGAFLKSLL
jgi:NAD-dependent SIR2 family protein deacetylase